MRKDIISYLQELMLPISGGVECLRDYRDEQKWISSDSRMSIPGQKGNLKEVIKEVEVQGFLIAKYPVTNSLYKAVLNELHEEIEINDTPVVDVSWDDAVSFCNILSKMCGLRECYTIDKDNSSVYCDWNANGYRLPTDAEWQYSCRATSTGYRYGEINEIAWYSENSDGMIHEVGKKVPNKWGLFDMIGNTWEWCWNLYDEKTYGQYRVFRGGSWAEQARGCGTTSRRRGQPSFKIDDLGFRLARSV